MDGNKTVRTWSVSNRISHSMDTEISAPYPESWSGGYIMKVLPKTLKMMPGCEIVEMNIQVDHIHIVAVIPPKYAVSDVIGKIKQSTASKMRGKFSWLEKVYWKERVVWSPGYFVSTVGLNEEQIINYVRWQGEQDSGQAKLEL